MKTMVNHTMVKLGMLLASAAMFLKRTLTPVRLLRVCFAS